MISLHRIRPIIKKEFRQIRRDKRSLGVLLVVPAFMLVLFGYALNYDVKHVPLAIYDQDRTTTSRELTDGFLHTEYFDKVAALTSDHQVDSVLTGQIARAVLVIPINFERDLRANRSVKIQVLVDGSNATNATAAAGYLAEMAQDYSTRLSLALLARAGGGRPALPIDYRARIWYNPELTSPKFLVPGLIGFILMIATVISTSLSIVRERENGTIEQIIVSPVHPMELIAGKTLPYVLISIISTSLILLTGYVLFDVIVRGNLLLLYVEAMIFILCGLGLGLWVSTVSSRQEQAFQLATLLSLLPTFMLSGFAFPIRNMPLPIQALTYINPARYFLSILRGIVLRGAGLEVFWQETLFMLAFATWIIVVSWNRLRKKVL
ncbi:MAG: ABC transporter permease [Bacteroidota bacterium]|nr:ABC transporter permease [Bacteroidota bacterium]MDP4231818.1 ABC transporter permease [Bacteroidota bacterium]MDP4242704.1 ABC transporter permease [Bacteroidota bacterium]MDP4287155.1 ABC transporter permease [Bacteroidota bacterium]